MFYFLYATVESIRDNNVRVCLMFAFFSVAIYMKRLTVTSRTRIHYKSRLLWTTTCAAIQAATPDEFVLVCTHVLQRQKMYLLT